jgi:hypothetical protein
MTRSVMCARHGRQTTHDYARFGMGAGVCTVPRTAPALDEVQEPVPPLRPHPQCAIRGALRKQPLPMQSRTLCGGSHSVASRKRGSDGPQRGSRLLSRILGRSQGKRIGAPLSNEGREVWRLVFHRILFRFLAGGALAGQPVVAVAGPPAESRNRFSSRSPCWR